VVIDHHPIPPQGSVYGHPHEIRCDRHDPDRVSAGGTDPPPTNLATALYHAIKTDTDNFRRQTLIEDIGAFQYLFRYANIALARRIDQAELRFDYLKYFKIALHSLRLRKGRVFVHLGPLPNPDICVVIADFFMRIHTVTWSIVSGICDKKLVIIFRNDGSRKNAGRVAKEGFGSLGSAGGHKSMARAEINLADWKDPAVDFKDDRKVTLWIVNRTEKRAGKQGPPPRPNGKLVRNASGG
jgi:nanoRNase/pAp phosphatase (c-di-AMP/oligoRNAs hydrolase)